MLNVRRKRKSQRTDEEDASGYDECHGMETKEDNTHVQVKPRRTKLNVPIFSPPIRYVVDIYIVTRHPTQDTTG